MYLFKVCFKVKICFDDKLPNSKDFKPIDPLANNVFETLLAILINVFPLWCFKNFVFFGTNNIRF